MDRFCPLTRRTFLAGTAISCSLFALPAMAETDLTQGDRFVFSAGAGGKISVIDVHLGQLETKLAVDHDIGQIVASEGNNVLFATDPGGRAVSVIDLFNGRVMLRNPLNMVPDVAIPAPDDSAIAYGGRDGVISIWSHRTNSQIVRATGFAPITGLTFDRHGQYLYVMQDGKREVGVVNIAKGWPDQPIPLPGRKDVALEPLSRSLDGGTGLLSLPDLDQLALLNLRENDLLDLVPVAADPRRPYVTGDGAHFLVPHGKGQAVTILNSQTTEILGVIELDYPVASIVTGWLDSFAFAVPEEGREMAVIDLQTYREITRIALPSPASAGIVTADTRLLALNLPDTTAIALINTADHSLALSLNTGLQNLRPPEMAVSGNICH